MTYPDPPAAAPPLVAPVVATETACEVAAAVMSDSELGMASKKVEEDAGGVWEKSGESEKG